MKGNIETQMELQRLNSELSAARTLVSRAINALEEVKIALEEDDVDEALRIINEATA